MIELEDLKESVLHGNVSLWKWLKNFIHADSYLYIDRNDMNPFYSLIWHKIINKITGK